MHLDVVLGDSWRLDDNIVNAHVGKRTLGEIGKIGGYCDIVGTTNT